MQEPLSPGPFQSSCHCQHLQAPGVQALHTCRWLPKHETPRCHQYYNIVYTQVCIGGSDWLTKSRYLGSQAMVSPGADSFSVTILIES